MTPRIAPQMLSADPLRAYLDPIVDRYERIKFIDKDPISIPHGFEDPRDREIIGLFAALLAWGRRDLMLLKLADLCRRMRYRPFEFVQTFSSGADSDRLKGFVHRTFNSSDAIWLCHSLRHVIEKYGSLESLCRSFLNADEDHVGCCIEGLSRTLLFGVEGVPQRMRKHLALPSSGSACKRLNLFFRWMVRPGPVDFGIWKSITPDLLLLPLDIHSGRQARALGLISRSANDWKSVLELTHACRLLNPNDPTRYDFAFFGTGAAGETLSLPITVD